MDSRSVRKEVLDAAGHENDRTSPPQKGDNVPLYGPLNHSCYEIRLLEILPSPDENAVVSCRLLTCSLVHIPKYIALSYVWGDPSVTKDIWVNERAIPVTRNLALALQNVRRAISLLLWADAICINQQDTKERNLQVQLMRSIYKNAFMVMLWAGQDDGSINLGIKSCGLIARELQFLEPQHDRINWMGRFP
jgi:hypothetical protein